MSQEPTYNADTVRVGRWLGLWTVERWNPRVPCWDVVYTFTSQERAKAWLSEHIDGDACTDG